MKRLTLTIFFALSAVAQTEAVHSVYILPMTGGLDQYLAEQITQSHVMQVVADPKTADAVLTDRLGEGFETKMAQIVPAEKAKKDDSMDLHPSFRSSGTRGTIFLVDAKSRRVLWSDYQKMSRSTSAGVMNREAARITKKLQTTFAGK